MKIIHHFSPSCQDPFIFALGLFQSGKRASPRSTQRAQRGEFFGFFSAFSAFSAVKEYPYVDFGKALVCGCAGLTFSLDDV
jgi:hypothetical protein